ncbi:regulator of G-protein signaling 10 isoform X4 [Pogona vitticeps]
MEEITDNDSKPSGSQQNLNGTTRWSTSLENLLEDPEGVKRFREFLKKEFSEENVLFWIACEEFKKIQDKKQMQTKANEIYMTFLSSKASYQVNVEGQSRLDESILETPHPLMFQKLQDQNHELHTIHLELMANYRPFKMLKHRLKVWPHIPTVSFF